MKKKYIIGYELNEKYCQISYYDEGQQEPHTLENQSDNYQIPLIIGRYQKTWVYGREAEKLEAAKKGSCVTGLIEKALAHEIVQLEDQMYEGVWLLSMFVKLTLKEFGQISYLTFSVQQITVEFAKLLKGIGQRLGLEKDCVLVQDYKESFCNYMFFQPKELWQYEAALFYCDRTEVKAYMLKKLCPEYGKAKGMFVTVDKVAEAKLDELAAIYPVLNVDKAKEADTSFCKFIESVFDKRLISSVFLTGEGFENNWYPNSLRVLCNGRRAFLGNNLYSSGACYTAYRNSIQVFDGPVYMDDTKLKEQVCIRIRVDGKDEWYPVVAWGSRWYESDRQFELLLEDEEDIELHVESMEGGGLRAVTVPLSGMPKRSGYAMRLQAEVLFMDENTCRITWKDVGFGEFFPASDFRTETVIHLGGSNGQFDSLS